MGFVRAARLSAVSAALAVLLACAAAPPAGRADETLPESAGAPTGAPSVPAAGDSLGVLPPSEPDTLALWPSPVDSLPLPFSQVDSLAPPFSAGDSLSAPSDTVSPEQREPWAGAGMPLKTAAQFLRPWSLRPPPGFDGLRAGGTPDLPGDTGGAPFTRSVLVDVEGGTVVVSTRAGKAAAFTTFAGPLTDCRRLTSARGLAESWKSAVGKSMAAAGTEASRGLLDIDIPMPLPEPIVRAIGTGANLKVRGSERITFGGQTSYVVDALEQESGPPSKWPQLDMEQQLTVNLEGTIGQKIHVYVDHRSGGETFGTGKANQIRVRYEGEEDEIIQGIELGEVNLSLPGTEFVSYSGSQEGLFGAKMTAKVGKLDIVSVASKEEGKSSSASFTGTSEADSLLINDVSYEASTFFAVDGDVLKYSNVALQVLRVYVDDRNGANDIQTGASPGRAYLESPSGSAPPPSGPSQRGMFDQLVELEDYLVDYQTGVVEFLDPVAASHVMAVSFQTLDGALVGGSDGDTLRLKLIKKDERVNGTAWEPIRRYELKNAYDLGAEDIPQDGFELSIKKRTPSGEVLDNQGGVPYIRILGLDTHGLAGDPTPDGIVDLEWIDFEKGYLFFPHFTPFCPDHDTTGFYYAPGGEPDPIYVADELDPKNCAVYSKEVYDPDDDIYFLEVKYDRPKTTFYLGQINIIENSEVVRLNGVKLTRGVDYTIYYPSGQLTLLSEEAKQPDARVTVEYDFQPFGIGGEKTLLGTRAVYNWSENIKLGTTWMYQGKGTPEDRPRLGEEPSRTVVGDLNVTGDWKPQLLTRVADAIPLVDTDAESKVSLTAEAAVCIPDPNTKGFVTIDDMEGADNVSMLGVTRRLWTHASVPVAAGALPEERMPIQWYNPDRKVREGDLHPELPEQEADDIHTVLEVSYEAAGSWSWAGVMRLLSKTGVDYSKDEFVEIWVNDAGTRQGDVYVDLGTLNEDFYPLAQPDGLLDSEDTDRNGFDADEDTGLDNVFGPDGDNVPGDDGNDDYEYSYGSTDYTKINGTERNERLDTEDLNGNWYLDTEEKYWQIELDLSDTTYLVQDNSELEAGNHWRLYRVPLDDALPVNGMADWTVVKSARVWLRGLATGTEPLMIGSIDIVGSQWETQTIRDASGTPVPEEEMGDMSFRVTSKNTKEDFDYVPPFDPGVDEETNLPKREQSLVFLYDNLRSGHSASVRKVLYSDDDYTGYESLELYVHGSEDIDAGTVFFVRIGADTNNYYEYSFDVSPGWRQRDGAAVNRLTVPFSAFTDLKLPPYDVLTIAEVPGDTATLRGETYRRVGAPSLSRVRRLTLGLRNGNEDSIASRISGEVWIDDVRLTDVRKDIGLAERASLEVKLADLADVNLDVRYVDGDFHSLKQTRGSGQDNLSANLNSTVNADRFVGGLGVALPVNLTWKRSILRPKFSTGSDVVLEPDESEREKTETLERSLSASLSRKRQSPDFWTHFLVDGVSLRGSVSSTQRVSPTKADTSSALRGRLSYKYSPEKGGIRVFRNTQVYLKPTSFRFNVDTQLIHNLSYDIGSSGERTLRTDAHDKKLDADATLDFQLLDNLRTSHSASARRDLGQAHRPWAGLNVGTETQRQYSNSLSFNPKFGSWLSPQYSLSSSFTDDHGPEVRRTGDPYGVRDVRAQTNQEVSASFDMKKLVGTAPPARPRPRGEVPREGPREGRSEEGRQGPEGVGGERPDGARDAGDEAAGETLGERAAPGEGSARDRGGESAAAASEAGQPAAAPGDVPAGGQAPAGEQVPTGEQALAGQTTPPGEKTPSGEQAPEGEQEEEGPGLRALVDPVMSFLRSMDAVEGRYSVKWNSKYDRILPEELPGWQYRLGLSKGEGADDRTDERTIDLGSGVKITEAVRIKGDYRRTITGRWYKSALTDTSDLTSRTEAMTETRKATLSWSGIEKVGPLKGVFTNVRARSGVEYKTSYSGPFDAPSTRGNSLALSPVVSFETTFRNGLTGSFSWDRKRGRTYNLGGVGSVSEETVGSTSLSLNYRFSAPQGLKLPFFGQKLRFQSNLDCSLTLRTSAKLTRTAVDEAGLSLADPTSSVKDFSVTGDATYSFSKNVSGGLQVSFAQSRDEKRDQTRRTIGVHLTAEFKF